MCTVDHGAGQGNRVPGEAAARAPHLQPPMRMMSLRPSWIDVGLNLVAVVALFGGLTAVILLSLSAGPMTPGDAAARAIAQANDAARAERIFTR
jgi:hypothetical protein